MFLYAAGPFLPFKTGAVLGFTALVVFITGFSSLGRPFKIASIIFLILGTALLAWARVPLPKAAETASSMANIIIILAGALVSLIWTLCLLKYPGLPPLLKSYWETGIFKAGEIGPFFVALGIFSESLRYSGILDLLGPALQTLTGVLGPIAVVLVSVLIAAGSLLGIHPFITLPLFGTLLASAGFPIPLLTVSLVLSIGGATAYMISPFAGVIITISKLLGAKPYDVAMRWNIRYSLIFFITATSLAFAFGSFFS